MPLWLAVVGSKKSGKTSTIEALIPFLKSQGYRVASVKHTIHQHHFDKPGSDSRRHADAGADRVAILSPDKMVIYWYNLENTAELWERYSETVFADYDIVLCEGFRNSPYPKIVVETEKGYDCPDPATTVASFKPVKKSGEKPDIPEGVLDKILKYIRENLR
jgi:molybdopterin-guanine dinucleotide biosynthesis protein MobB